MHYTGYKLSNTVYTTVYINWFNKKGMADGSSSFVIIVDSTTYDDPFHWLYWPNINIGRPRLLIYRRA